MFPLLRTRAARVLDVAIEFATLGEYRLEEPIAQAAPARGATRGTEPAERMGGAQARPAARLVAAEGRPAARLVAAEGRPAARLVAPASAAALLLRPASAAALAGSLRTRSVPAAAAPPAPGAARTRSLPPGGAPPAAGPGRSRSVPPVPAPAISGTGRARALPATPLDEAGAIKQLALDFDGTVPRPAVRARGGAAPAAPQPCESPRR